jgi:hypothetical protein
MDFNQNYSWILVINTKIVVLKLSEAGLDNSSPRALSALKNSPPFF